MAGHKIDLEIEGLTKDEITAACEELGLGPEVIKVRARKHATGIPVIDIAVALSKIDVNLLSLLVGYFLGKGLSIYQLAPGHRTLIKSLKQAKSHITDASVD